MIHRVFSTQIKLESMHNISPIKRLGMFNRFLYYLEKSHIEKKNINMENQIKENMKNLAFAQGNLAGHGRSSRRRSVDEDGVHGWR